MCYLSDLQIYFKIVIFDLNINSVMGKVKRKGRTASFTIEEMLDSVRWRIAVDYFHTDKSFMRAMLIELLWECTNVTKSTLIKRYAQHSSLSAFEMIPFLRATDEFDTYNLWFGLSEVERDLYLGDIKGTLSPEEREQLLTRVKEKFMQSSPNTN
jgi:hypothetical protein